MKFNRRHEGYGLVLQNFLYYEFELIYFLTWFNQRKYNAQHYSLFFISIHILQYWYNFLFIYWFLMIHFCLNLAQNVFLLHIFLMLKQLENDEFAVFFDEFLLNRMH